MEKGAVFNITPIPKTNSILTSFSNKTDVKVEVENDINIEKGKKYYGQF